MSEMTFAIDESAPRLPESDEIVPLEEILGYMNGSVEVYSRVGEHEDDVWSLTPAGQFVRQTGADGERYFVVPVDRAREFLEEFAPGSVLDELRAAGVFGSSPDGVPAA